MTERSALDRPGLRRGNLSGSLRTILEKHPSRVHAAL